jgi:hypothetical protein
MTPQQSGIRCPDRDRKLYEIKFHGTVYLTAVTKAHQKKGGPQAA